MTYIAAHVSRVVMIALLGRGRVERKMVTRVAERRRLAWRRSDSPRLAKFWWP